MFGTRRVLLLISVLLATGAAASQPTRSTACIGTVCLGDSITELRKTRWIDSKGRGPAALDPASRLKALGLYPGNEALELIPKIPGICKFEPLGQWFFLENEDRFLVA
jgi:hypothetical protein